MKVTATKYLNVRVGKPSVNAPCYQYLAPGSILEVDGKLYPGDEYLGNRNWLKDEANNYYWSGGVELPEISVELTQSNSKPSFQWLKNIGIDEIWNSYKEYGDDATVAILDTGYDVSNTDLPMPELSKVFVKSLTGTTTIQDNLGHGTFCTSLIACKNQHTNIGIAPKCKILIGKVSHAGELQDFNLLLDGIDWAIQSGADIISISMGIPIDDQDKVLEIQTKYNQIIHNRNILIFAASGDSHSGHVISKEFYPASLENCISIGTANKDLIDNITVRSYETIIHTIGIDIQGYNLNNIIERQSGTSMSTAIISGLMALAVSLIKKENNGQWNKDVLLSKLIRSGNPITAFPRKKLVNIKQLFQIL